MIVIHVTKTILLSVIIQFEHVELGLLSRSMHMYVFIDQQSSYMC